MLLAAAAVGFLGALSSVGFRRLIDLMELWIIGSGGDLVHVATLLPWWKRLIIPTVGGLVAGVILFYAARLLRGAAKSTDYMEAISATDGNLPLGNSLMKCFSSLFSIATGGSLGREGSMIQISALVATMLGFGFRFISEHRRLLIACGASAGFASAYNAPLAGSLFIAEVILGSITPVLLGPILLSAVISALTVHHYLGSNPVYTLPAFQLTSDWELINYLVLGAFAGVMGPLFIKGMSGARDFFKWTRLSPPLALGLGGLITGSISVFCPEVWGNGYSVANAILADRWVGTPLLFILFCKMLATASTTGSGAVGGVFTPTLFTGAALGGLVGDLVHRFLPAGLASDPSHYAAVGMGAFLAATTHAPFMAILMIFELTLRYEVTMPLTLAAVLATFVAKSILPESIYSKQLKEQEK